MTEKPLGEMTLSELRTLAEERGVPKSGTKPALIERLTSADAPAEKPEDDAGSEPIGLLTEEEADTMKAAIDESKERTTEQVTQALDVSKAAAPRKVYTMSVTAVRPDTVDPRWHEKNHRLVQRRAADAGKVPTGQVRLVGQVPVQEKGQRPKVAYHYEVNVE